MVKKATKQDKPVRKKGDSWINDDIPVNTGLPPQVDGQLRCFLKLNIPQVVWTIVRPPDLGLVRVTWWGEQGSGILFRPHDVKKGKAAVCHTTARYPVRSGPCQFATYLNDMGNLTLDMLTGPESDVIGQASISQIGLLTNTRPINGFFPVVSPSGQKLANLQVSIVLEPLMASYDAQGCIPTPDVAVNAMRKGHDATVFPATTRPLPYTELPSKPESTVFISPSTVNDRSNHDQALSHMARPADDLRRQLNYGVPGAQNTQQYGSTGTVAITTNGDVVNLPNRTGIIGSHNHNNSNASKQEAGNQSKPSVNGETDLLSVLVNRGNKLREAMIVSSMHTAEPTASSLVSRPVNPALALSPTVTAAAPAPSDGAGFAASADAMSHPESAMDLLMASPVRNQDFQMYKLMNGLSPGTSMSSDMGYDQMFSEPEDPLHENSILQELFYYNSDNECIGLSDMSGLGGQHHSLMAEGVPKMPVGLLGGSAGSVDPLHHEGNQRPPSRTSSVASFGDEDEVSKVKKKVKRKARSRSRSGSRSGSKSQSRSRSRTPSKPVNKAPKGDSKTSTTTAASKENKPLKTRRKSRSRSTSQSRSRRRNKRNVEEGSDSDRMSTSRSEVSRVSFNPSPSDINKPNQDGLSVERLTLLGRVHVARVNVEALQLLKPQSLDASDSKLSVSKLGKGKPPRPLKSKKACTYFVEYQFPVVALSGDKYTPNATATEVTRVASKNIKNGAVTFNHRSVFPIMFDGSAIERWWRSALVFRLYSREAGQNSPTLIGSGGVSLKSILRSENLCVQRDIEIPDISKNGLLNSSHSASFNSSMSGRSNSHLFGSLKISVELGSDHREFATVMARTKLAEMSGRVKVVPIGGPHPEQARLVEQLNQNKDQPLIKSPTKKIDLPPTANNPSVTGLPPQSPRRKVSNPALVVDGEVEEDEISKLKQQLKVTLAVLSGQGNQPGKTPHMDEGAQVLSKTTLEPHTLHSMLYIQEGRNISLTGIPPLHLANRQPGLLQAQTANSDGRDGVTRNTYLVCRMFWCNEAVRSDVSWGTLSPDYNFLQIAPALMTGSLLERMRDNYMIVEVWDKKVSSDMDKLVGMVKLSLHQFYLSFRERKIANAMLKSQYPVMAVDNYMPIVDLFSGLHFGQLKVVLAMGSEQQISTLQRLALDSSGTEQVPQRPTSYLERQDLLLNGEYLNSSDRAVEHQFEIVIEGVRGLKLFENMIWGEADCFVQFFFPSEGESSKEELVTAKSLPTMKCFRTATTLCTPDPTFHDTSRHKLILPVGVPVQRELLTACANSGGGVSGLPFEVWCRYYHPNVRDQLIAKCTLPLAKLCAMVTMHKRGEPCVQSFPLRLIQVGMDGQQDDPEALAKSKDSGIIDVTVQYKSLAAQTDTINSAGTRNHEGSQVCLSVGVVRASGLKAAADYAAQLDSSMRFPADVGINSYVRIKISFLGKENERMTKTVARCFTPEFGSYMDFPCPLLRSSASSTHATSLAELMESAEAVFEIWHQMPTGLHKDLIEKTAGGVSTRRFTPPCGDVLLGTTIVPLMSLLTRHTGLNGWFAINLPNVGWSRPEDMGNRPGTALDQVVGGLELSLRFAHQEDRDRVITAGRSVGWSPIDLDVEQPDWQDEDSHHRVHHLNVCVDEVSFPVASALLTGQTQVDAAARCYIRYKFYDKGAVVSKRKKVFASDSGSLLASVHHKHSFMLSHTAPLQWYLREERLEIQAWLTYGRTREGEKKPGQRDKLIGSCYMDMESLTDMRRRQQRISGLYPLYKPGTTNLKGAFIRASITSGLTANSHHQNSDHEKMGNGLDITGSFSEADQSSDGAYQLFGEFKVSKSPKKRSKESGQDLKDSFTVQLAVERAMHLPLVTERNRSGEIHPTTYISYQSAERSNPTCSCVFPNSANPMWDYAVETRLSTEYLYKENKNLVLKVWHKPSDAPKSPDKSSDKVLGFVSVDLSPLTKGLQQICGWYNIMDFNGQCRGQIKVSITPQDLQGNLTSSGLGSNWIMPPSFCAPSVNLPTSAQAVTSNIAQQLVNLQQQVMLRMGSLATSTHMSAVPTTLDVNAENIGPIRGVDCTQGSAVNAEDVPSTRTHWQPRFAQTSEDDDKSKSYLFSSLRRQLNDLDTITQRLKTRLTTPIGQDGDTSQHQIHSARSGEILTGTQSGLSTINTASSLMNTRESSAPSRYNNASTSEVGTSQDSNHSRTMNGSTLLEAAEANSGVKQGDGKVSGGFHRLLDSGVFSAKNFSEKSAEDASDSQRSEKNEVLVLPNSMSSADVSANSKAPQTNSAPIGTLEAGFLFAASENNTQTLFPTIENSEGSSNSHGFVLGTHNSNVTAESVFNSGFGRNGLKETSGSSAVGTSKTPSGSESAPSEKHTVQSLPEEKEESEDYSSDTEEEEAAQMDGRFGNYHHYRAMLDEEEDERDEGEISEEEADQVEVIPKSLNNMSTVLALATSDNVPDTQKCDDHNEENITPLKTTHEPISFSPNTNLHEGTSLWCSEDNDDNNNEGNDDSFFQQVFERNKHLMQESGEDGENVNIDSWLEDQDVDCGQTRLETWLETHSADRSLGQGDVVGVEDRVLEDEQPTSSLVEEVEEALAVENLEENDDSEDEEEIEEELTVRQRDGDMRKEDMRLQLGHDSDGDETPRAGGGNVWTQNIKNSSDEDTARDGLEQQQRANDFFSDVEKQTISRLESLHLEGQGEGYLGEVDEVTDLPQQFSNQHISLLSNVELIDTLGSSSQVNDWTSKSSGEELVPLVPSSNQETLEGYPFTLELADTIAPHTGNYIGEGARPKIRHLLSNVDLDSNASSKRPHSGSSQASRASAASSRSKGSRVSHSSKKSTSSSRTNERPSPRSAGSNHVSQHLPPLSQNASRGMNAHPEEINMAEKNDSCRIEQEAPVNTIKAKIEREEKRDVSHAASKYGGHSDRDSTWDSAYIDGEYSDGHSTHPNSIVVVNGDRHNSQEDLHPEDSGVGERDRDDSGLPNFFMPAEDMQASIRALQIATSAAVNVNKGDLKSEKKVKAMSELVNKIAGSRRPAPPMSLKNKQPLSEEETKRIARIFSSKMS